MTKNYSATVAFTLVDETQIGSFTKTVFVWFQDAAGNVSTAISDDIMFDNPVLFVNADASGDNNGTSWDNAYTDFQTAINSAVSGEEIWVAAGTYKPGTTRESSFSMKNGVGLYGGFTGTETERDQRDWETNPTILSCDIGVADVSADNCYHVFYHYYNGLDSSAILDGFQVKDGNAAVSDNYHGHGGGMYNYGSSPTIRNNVFSGNTALIHGGGMYNRSCSSVIHNTVFSGNTALVHGGGIHNSSGSPSISNSIVSGNTAVDRGGGIYNGGSGSPSISNSTISGNTSGNLGGGIHNSSGSLSISNSMITGNTAADSGGGIVNYFASASINNCVISDNTSLSSAGGIYNSYSSASITNSVISDNTSLYGGGIYDYNSTSFNSNSIISGNTADYGGGLTANDSSHSISNSIFSGNAAVEGGGVYCINDSSATIRNSIFWDNGSSEMHVKHESSISAIYSNIQGGYAGEGNIDADPLFVDAANGDFHLQAGSPVINSGSNAHLPADSMDLDGDGNTTEPLPYDLDGNPRIIGGTVDMGAYEYNAE